MKYAYNKLLLTSIIVGTCFNLNARTGEEEVATASAEPSATHLFGEPSPHKGYPSQSFRQFILKTEGYEPWLIEVPQSLTVAQLKEMFMRYVNKPGKLRIIYQGREVMTDSTAVVGDGASYLIPGDLVHSLELNLTPVGAEE